MGQKDNHAAPEEVQWDPDAADAVPVSEIGFWNYVIEPFDDPRDLLDDTEEVVFYSKYPSELADSLARDVASLKKGKRVLQTESLLFRDLRWWRLFVSTCISCPINTQPFIELGALWQEAAGSRLAKRHIGWVYAIEKDPAGTETFELLIHGVCEELKLFLMWLRASGRINDRPTIQQVEERARATFLRELQQLWKTVDRYGNLPAKQLLQKSGSRPLHLKVLSLLGLYTYKRQRNDLREEAESSIERFAISAEQVRG